MMLRIMMFGVLLFGASCLHAEDGFIDIFDGKTLEGWDGDPKLWRVEEGAIVGETTEDYPLAYNSFLIWRGGSLGNFELKVEYKLRNHNSGIQYRSFELPDAKWGMGGYQADIDETGRHTGLNYGERFGGMLAPRGKKGIVEGPKRKVVSSEIIGDPKELIKHVNLSGWNEYHIIAKGNHLVQKINGHVMSEVIDNSEARRNSGLLAFQLHKGPPMKIWFRNVRYKLITSK